jgi:hypothetical protein
VPLTIYVVVQSPDPSVFVHLIPILLGVVPILVIVIRMTYPQGVATALVIVASIIIGIWSLAKDLI